jgi:hypothetical protein
MKALLWSLKFFSAVASGGVFADRCVEASVVIIVELNLLACVASCVLRLCEILW